MSLFDYPRSEILPKELSSAFRSIREAERNLPGLTLFSELRASSFPVCPRAYHISRRLPKQRRPPRKEKFMLDAAATLGTALHLVMQKWFAIMMPEHFFGNWKCPTCKTHKTHQFGMQTCKKCGNEMQYDELYIPRGKKIPASGHIDGILCMNGVNYLLDFKGSMQERMRDMKTLRQPKNEHYCQTNYYSGIINSGRVDFGPLDHIDKIIILYIERGKAHRLWEPMLVPPSRKIFKSTTDFIRTAKKSLKSLTVPRGFCLDPTDDEAKWCPWKELCFSPLLEDYLSDTVYEELKFAGSSPSPLDRFFKEE